MGVTRERKIRITNQSFREAGGPEQFSDLEMIGVVTAGVSEVDYDEGVDLANQALERKLINGEEGITDVFKAEYKFQSSNRSHPGYNRYFCRVIGTAYAPRGE